MHEGGSVVNEVDRSRNSDRGVQGESKLEEAGVEPIEAEMKAEEVVDDADEAEGSSLMVDDGC